MNITTVKRPQERFETKYDSNLNIQLYGNYNIYPQRMKTLIENSPTGGTCLDRFQTFIEGNGFDDVQFSEYICNRAGDTVDDVFKLVVTDMAMFHGFALHVNYDLTGRIVELQHVPFQNTRLEEPDDLGAVAYINVHHDWAGKATKKGRYIRITKENIQKIHVFNPIPKVVLAQIEAAGGMENYKGQILWYSMDGKFVYPKPIYDKVVTNLSTDEGIDNVKYRNVRNNFLLAGMLIHKKGATLSIDSDGNEVIDDENADFTKSLEEFQGDMNSCTIMDVTLNSDEDAPKFVNFEGASFDNKFQSTEASTVERIYSAFGQEPWYCIRTGRLGFSGKVLGEAYEYYNSYVSRQRRAISREFKRIFNHWNGTPNKVGNYEIQPLVYVSNDKTE